MPTLATLDLRGSDDNVNKSRNYRRPQFTISWSEYRGPAAVTFDNVKPEIDKATGHAVTTATVSAPGEYWLKAVANDSSGDGGGGFQCC